MYAADHGAQQLRIKVVVIQDGVTRASYVTYGVKVAGFLVSKSRLNERKSLQNGRKIHEFILQLASNELGSFRPE